MIRSSLVVFSLVVSIVPYWLLLFYSGSMDHLHRYGVSINLPKNEFVDMLSSHHPDDLDKLRQSLFQELSSKDLIPDEFKGIPLITRCDTIARPCSKILSDDCWVLMDCISHLSTIPRVLLKNGKHDKLSVASQPRLPAVLPTPTSLPIASTAPPPSLPPSSCSAVHPLSSNLCLLLYQRIIQHPSRILLPGSHIPMIFLMGLLLES